jgi:hypothetical protein
MNMISGEKLAELRGFQAKADSIREECGTSSPGELLFLATPDTISADAVVVEANGFGGATTSVVVGNYPLDYVTKFERSFPTEKEAVVIAEALAFDGASPSNAFGTLATSVI